jgi:nitrogen fixation NifU-like protein
MQNEKIESFDFLQEHSRKYLEMALRTDRSRIVEEPDGYGKRTGQCGDTIEMFLQVRDECVESVTHHCRGCMNTNACANTVSFLAEGRTVSSVWEISAEDVAQYLETLPPDEIHCAELAVGALYRALVDYRDRLKSPWKKSYPRR